MDFALAPRWGPILLVAMLAAQSSTHALVTLLVAITSHCRPHVRTACCCRLMQLACNTRIVPRNARSRSPSVSISIDAFTHEATNHVATPHLIFSES
jgi:hypothetical protein